MWLSKVDAQWVMTQVVCMVSQKLYLNKSPMAIQMSAVCSISSYRSYAHGHKVEHTTSPAPVSNSLNSSCPK